MTSTSGMAAVPGGRTSGAGEFDERVWDEIRKISPGETMTYGEIARRLGTRAYRAVGGACRKSPGLPDVPCHRVVNSRGLLHGFNGGLEKKRSLLEAEGVKTAPCPVHGRMDYRVVGFRPPVV